MPGKKQQRKENKRKQATY